MTEFGYSTGTISVDATGLICTLSGGTTSGTIKVGDLLTLDGDGQPHPIVSIDGPLQFTIRFASSLASTSGNGYQTMRLAAGWANNLAIGEQTAKIIQDLNVFDARGRGVFYQFDSSTLDADPGAGKFRLDNENPALATEIYLDDLDQLNNATSSFIQRWTVGSSVVIFKSDDDNVFAHYALTEIATDESGYRKIAALTYLDGAGAFSPDDDVSIGAMVKGDKGAPGDADDGDDGTNGTNGLDGGGMPGLVLRAVADTDVDISSGLEAGDTVGGVVLVDGYAVLLPAQTDPAQNGIYPAVASGAASRHPSFGTFNKNAGAIFSILEGDSAGETYHCTSAKGGTIDTDDLVFVGLAGGGSVDELFDGALSHTLTQKAQARANIGAPVGEFRNVLVNPLLGINQRDVAGTVVLSAGEYGHDRFKAGAGGCTYTFSENNGVTALDISAGTLVQIIEAGAFAGRAGNYYLSWVGDAQARIGAGGYGDSGAVSAAVDGSANVSIEFGTGTVALPQFELGYVTDFSGRWLGRELELCQRYLPVISTPISPGGVGFGLAHLTSAIFAYIPYPAPPRLDPSGIIVSAASDFSVYNGSAGVRVATSVSFSTTSEKRLGVKFAVAGTPFSTSAAAIVNTTNTSGKIIATGCEL